VSERMCISAICEFCKKPYPITDMRKTSCENPECREKAKFRHKHLWMRPERHCKYCGDVIKVGSGMRKYCSPDCYKLDRNKIKRELREKAKMTNDSR
jgi:predicted nucleic acid-binding Zn ribbon protein